MRLASLALLATLVGTAGCSLYFSDSDSDTDTADAGSPDASCSGDPRPPVDIRNPETLTCTSIGSGDPCPLSGAAAPAPLPAWALCDSGCENLDEFTCLTRFDCRVTYDHGCFTGESACTAFTPYLGCFGLSQTGAPDVACDALDSWACSSRRDCAALHTEVCDPTNRECWQQFIACAVAPVAGSAR